MAPTGRAVPGVHGGFGSGCREAGEAGAQGLDVGVKAAVVLAPGGLGGGDDDFEDGVDVEHRAVEYEVIEGGVGGVASVEPVHVLGSNAVGGVEAAPSGVEIDALPGRTAPRSTVGRTVEADVERSRMPAQGDGGGPTEGHGTALADEIPERGLVGRPEAL